MSKHQLSIRFQHLSAKDFLKNPFRSICQCYRHKQGCGSPTRIPKTATPPRNALKTALSVWISALVGALPKGLLMDAVVSAWCTSSSHSKKERGKSSLVIFASFGLSVPCLCTAPLAYRSTTLLPSLLCSISLQESTLLFSSESLFILL